MMPSNQAAWQNTRSEKLEVKSAPYTSPGANEIVVKNQAWAINPIDTAIQDPGIFDFVQYPTILGYDVAGEVVEVGSGVTRFKPGDRVIAIVDGCTINKLQESAFQHYTIVQVGLASPIPDSMSFESASVLPLGLCTAACGLFQKDFLSLQHPSVNPKPTGKTILVWGGASSVGSNAIQLSAAAGYRVLATASSKNFELLKSLGASQVFDYKSPSVVADIMNALPSDLSSFAGAFHTAGPADPTYDIASQVATKTSSTVFVSGVLPGPDPLPAGVKSKMIWGTSLKDNEVGPAIWIDFLPHALAQGKYITAPEPMIVGHGLEALQEAFDAQRAGVSAKKVVVLA